MSEASPRNAESHSAVIHALQLPEILYRVFANLCPPRDTVDAYSGAAAYVGNYTGIDSDDNIDDEADAASRQVARHVATHVSRAWFSAVAALTWRCSSEQAFAFNPSASRDGCNSSAAHVRTVRLFGRCPLWAALAGKNAAYGGDNGGVDRGGTGGICLPRLQSLHMGPFWRDDEHGGCRWFASQQAQRDQALLLRRYVTHNLQQLSCLLTSDPMAALETLQGQPTSLHTMRLYGRDYGASASFTDAEQRLVTWLTKQPSPAPQLKSVRLPSVFARVASWPLIDVAFCHFALYSRVEDLLLGYCRAGPSPQVSVATVYRVIRATHGLLSGIHETYAAAGLDGAFASQASSLDGDDVSMLEPQSPCRPFEQLRRLAITINAAAMAPLTQLLPPTLTSLSVEILDRDSHGSTVTAAATAADVYGALAELAQLRELRVHIPSWELAAAPADFLALGRLTQLRALELDVCHGPYAIGETLASLLRLLPALRSLALGPAVGRNGDQLLRLVGRACRQLRRLQLAVPCQPMFGWGQDAQTAPLFPCLETLVLWRARIPGFAPNKREAEWYIQHLREHSPALKELVVGCQRNSFAYRHRLITELGDSHQRALQERHMVEARREWTSCTLCLAGIGREVYWPLSGTKWTHDEDD